VRLRFKQVDTFWQYNHVKKNVENRISDLHKTGNYIQGIDTTQFESEFKEYLNVDEFIAVANGTDALELILRALDIGPNNEVIIPNMTFFATFEAVFNVGATPILIDTDEFGIMDIEQVQRNITSKTRALIPVHLNGYPVDIMQLKNLLDDSRIHIIEDACQAHCTRVFNELAPGRLSKAAAFSFYPGKNLGGIGDSGGIATMDEALARRIRKLRDHGRSAKYSHDEIGRNSRMDSIQAIVLSEKLRFLEDWYEKRNRNSQILRNSLKNLPFRVPPLIPNSGRHGHHLFPILFEHRDKLIEYLVDHGVQITVQYPKTISQNLNLNSKLPNSTRYANEVLSIPFAEHLDLPDLESILNTIENYFE
jgi:dTDP-4-amino-4,6-dideoxygalactose transaminase